VRSQPNFHLCGTGAVLMDVSEGPFSLEAQQHLWSLGAADGPLQRLPGVRNVVLGVNNVLVTFDALQVHPQQLGEAMAAAWQESQPGAGTGRRFEVEVAYDLSAGSELHDIARHVGLDAAEVVRLHTSVEYHVACIGSVPGFAYMVGLPPQLATPRLDTPRARIPKGAVAIGGPQTAVIPMDMPSGWRVLGHTELDLFDPFRPEPALLAPGDRIRFSAAGGGS
jgi:5-oxoprolinase (ATP-hydrolysing) subunit B